MTWAKLFAGGAEKIKQKHTAEISRRAEGKKLA
jgi:hypothetical protein